MTDAFHYQGYTGTVEADAESDILFGKVLFIRGLIVYEAETVPQLRKNFESAIDNYLASCQADGTQPEKPASGTFNVRIGPKLHQAATMAALRSNVSLNEWVKRAVETQLENESKSSPMLAAVVSEKLAEDEDDDFTSQFHKMEDATGDELMEG